MNDIKKLFWDTVKELDKNNVLEYIVLIGSWAEYIYEVSGYFKDFEANLKTKDIDLLIKNINKPKEGINIVKILEDIGYDTAIDYLDGTYKFYKGKDLEIEFLVREMGKGQSQPYKVTSFGIKAEGLRYTDLLINNAIQIRIKGIKINVPSPQAYLIQKIIINKQRKQKADKDFLAIENLLENIKRSDPELKKLLTLYNSLTKKQKKIIDLFLSKNFLKMT